MEHQTNNLKEEISKHKFYFELGLYSPITEKEMESGFYYGTVDAYNHLLKENTTYSISKFNLAQIVNNGIRESSIRHENIYVYLLRCQRKNTPIYIVTREENGNIIKIGQNPSITDIQFVELDEKYNKFLDKKDLRNFKQALSLNYYNAGAGAFVYLRRIFENLIFDTYEENKSLLNGIVDSDFKLKKMEEKIEIIKDLVPEELIEMKSVYKILSKGVHELSEEECLEYFDPLKLCIELILDKRIELQNKKTRKENIKKELDKINKVI